MKGVIFMSNELISKKELLNITGISYGQLYRWKRKDLIPEEWFIRKSTYTGQETFFPKEEILERISKIQMMKENVSLDDLANMFSPVSGTQQLTKDSLIGTKLVSETVVNFYFEHGNIYQETLDFQHILAMYALEKLLTSGEVMLAECEMVVKLIHDYYFPAESKNLLLIIIRKMGVSTGLILEKSNVIHFDENTKVISQIDFLQLVEELKMKLE
jgi:hypothetical protein